MALSIGEVAKRAGLRASAIRYYEAQGLLPHAERAGGKRCYAPEILERLAAIRIAQQAGFTIAEIRTLLAGFPEDTPPSERWRALARRKIEEVDALIARAESMRRLLVEGLECGCVRWSECALKE